MNSIITKQRNGMGNVHLDMSVRIKSYLQSNGAVDLDCVYKVWVQAKDGREKK